MAELLLKASYVQHPDPEEDALRYKPGMVVAVMPDGHPWGTAEGLPNFYLLKLPGIAVDKVQKYLNSPIDSESGKMKRRRSWQVLIDSLPPAARNILDSKGQVTIKAGLYGGPASLTWQQAKNYIKNLDTGLTEDEVL